MNYLGSGAEIAKHNIVKGLRFHLVYLLTQQFLDIVLLAKFVLVFAAQLSGSVVLAVAEFDKAGEHAVYFLLETVYQSLFVRFAVMQLAL